MVCRRNHIGRWNVRCEGIPFDVSLTTYIFSIQNFRQRLCINIMVWSLGRPRRRWEDNIKMDLQEVGRGCGTGWSWLRIGTGGGHL